MMGTYRRIFSKAISMLLVTSVFSTVASASIHGAVVIARAKDAVHRAEKIYQLSTNTKESLSDEVRKNLIRRVSKPLLNLQDDLLAADTSNCLMPFLDTPSYQELKLFEYTVLHTELSKLSKQDKLVLNQFINDNPNIDWQPIADAINLSDRVQLYAQFKALSQEKICSQNKEASYCKNSDRTIEELAAYETNQLTTQLVSALAKRTKDPDQIRDPYDHTPQSAYYALEDISRDALECKALRAFEVEQIALELKLSLDAAQILIDKHAKDLK
ncbi:hypothetical protein CSW98_12495 [Vibrio sp. HA2012]|uniref:hypothetical protein n=1 Tax=Vibrio sp. HA2012 TaxID=1971595 RepID=UPI000C2B7082|nr:hypothetical protein [Vibrio sp. HA2012]PJC85870.1 hypothetical protein CSW98_12495 [Vibrio sp. HA2012]